MEDDNEQVKSFKDMGICEPLAEACENFGWKTPSYFQANFIPHALNGKDLIGRAEASSNNVGAFALPILQAFSEAPQNFSTCVISPTRERAREIVELFKALGSCIGVKCGMGKWTDINTHESCVILLVNGQTSNMHESCLILFRMFVVLMVDESMAWMTQLFQEC